MTSLTYRCAAAAAAVVATTSLITMTTPAAAMAAPHRVAQTAPRPTLAQTTRTAHVQAYRAKVAVAAAARQLQAAGAALQGATALQGAAYSRLDVARKDLVAAQARDEAHPGEESAAAVAAAQEAVRLAQTAVDDAVSARSTALGRYQEAARALRTLVAHEQRARARAKVLAAALRRQRAAEAHSRWVRDTRAAVVRAAVSRVGAPYTYGGEGPWGFDCSGLTMWSYAQVGIEIPHYSGAQLVTPRAVPVPVNAMLPGDLMYFGAGGSRHVALYIGNGQIVEANNPSTGVRIDPAFASWNMYDYAGSTRLIY